MSIEIDIVQQYYRDALKVLTQERRGVWTPVNPLPPSWDSDRDSWKPGDTVGDIDAIRSNQSTALYTITKMDDEYVYIKGVSGKVTATLALNLLRLQVRKS